jgi:hypothetical protein
MIIVIFIITAGSELEVKVKAEKKQRRLESIASQDTDDGSKIVFEDFKRMRTIDLAD